MKECQACPSGKYASQLKGQRDFYKCPAPASPEIRFAAGFPWKAAISTSDPVPAECMTLTVGAHECTACPASAPYTHGTGSKTVDDCRRCPEEHYGTPCKPCRPKCNYPQEYETQECTPDHDRICSFCDMESCDPTTEYVLMEGCTTSSSGRACAPCEGHPPNSHLVPGKFPYTCSWQCDEGYFSPLEDRSEAVCQPCTQLDATSCPAGYLYSSCSDLSHRDASCDIACRPSQYGKPVENSEWVLTMASPDGTSLVENVALDMSIPNAGCMWRCVAGYRKQVLADLQLSICVPASS